MQVIAELKEREASFSSKKQSKVEEQHILLRQTLENKVEAIDKELLVSHFFPKKSVKLKISAHPEGPKSSQKD